MQSFFCMFESSNIDHFKEHLQVTLINVHDTQTTLEICISLSAWWHVAVGGCLLWLSPSKLWENGLLFLEGSTDITNFDTNQLLCFAGCTSLAPPSGMLAAHFLGCIFRCLPLWFFESLNQHHSVQKNSGTELGFWRHYMIDAWFWICPEQGK